MVHRLIGLLVLSVIPGIAASATPFFEMEKDRIREEAQMDIMRHPADTNIESDMALVRALFRRKPSEAAGSTEAKLSEIQVFVEPAGARAHDLLSLIADTIGYELAVAPTPALDTNVRLLGQSRSVDRILADIEEQAGLYIWLYPDSRLLVTRTRPDER